jgi:hypothetical protein
MIRGREAQILEEESSELRAPRQARLAVHSHGLLPNGPLALAEQLRDLLMSAAFQQEERCLTLDRRQAPTPKLGLDLLAEPAQ